MQYAGFWRRLGAYLIDMAIWMPIAFLAAWLSAKSRFFYLYWFLPSLLLGLWYEVYLVKRFGGTPGKLLLNVQIARLDGTPVSYKEAFLRYGVVLLLTLPVSVAYVMSALGMTDQNYLLLTLKTRGLALIEHAPHWYKPAHVALQCWIWSEFFVLLTNKERRALHDFIAGTVVIRRSAA